MAPAAPPARAPPGGARLLPGGPKSHRAREHSHGFQGRCTSGHVTATCAREMGEKRGFCARKALSSGVQSRGANKGVVGGWTLLLGWAGGSLPPQQRCAHSQRLNEIPVVEVAGAGGAAG